MLVLLAVYEHEGYCAKYIFDRIDYRENKMFHSTLRPLFPCGGHKPDMVDYGPNKQPGRGAGIYMTKKGKDLMRDLMDCLN